MKKNTQGQSLQDFGLFFFRLLRPKMPDFTGTFVKNFDCSGSTHVKEEWKYVNKTKTVKLTLEDVKAKYEKNKEENEKQGNLLGSLQREKETLEENKTAFLDEAYQHVVKLEEIALNVVSLSTYVHLDFLIEEMEKKNDTEKVNRLRQIESLKYEGLQAGAKYMYNAISQMVKRRWQKWVK